MESNSKSIRSNQETERKKIAKDFSSVKLNVPTFLIFVLGMGFFLQTNFDFLTSHFDGYFYNSKGIVVLSLNFKKDILPLIPFCKVMGV